jgi:hypothetical protein
MWHAWGSRTAGLALPLPHGARQVPAEATAVWMGRAVCVSKETRMISNVGLQGPVPSHLARHPPGEIPG